MKSRLFFLLFLIFAAVFAGCSSEELKQVRAAEKGELLPGDAFSVETTLCRKVSRKSGRRIGEGTEFKVRKKSYVRALVDFDNVKTERPYTIHLSWLRPDGKEMFRKFAEVRQSQLQDGQFQTVINWLKAENLHYSKADTLVSDEPEFTMESKFNISEKKAREPGLYHFRVYLDRGLLMEEPFEVVGPPVEVEES
ncbi:MAG: hypothetical protein GY780_08320 [bacterium]|nr:hypothetical protein [bacterium]